VSLTHRGRISLFSTISGFDVAARAVFRLETIDRLSCAPSSPGMGHSTDVPLHQRISVWVELVPRLLAHLGIAHVALASHSAGTIYLLNTLSCCRHVLHPDTPFMALLGTYVSCRFAPGS
jgi:pimeloyl-ACP methyl ester carboxylesterase